MDNFSKSNVSVKRLEDTKQYGEYYDDNRFWRKVKRLAKRSGKTVLRPILLLYYLMQDSNVSIKDKAYIIGALGYFVLPVDILPDFIIGVGYTDDLAVIGLLLTHLQNCITPEIEKMTDQKINELLHV
ncbi:MAG: DUF1232 domain-containing protein [Tannerella sp.]|jgi:uncharacterized membrane protein YkvA (DUF1232 family)|nr:DUF1232 domain-containing protein [Tannerella sp.]